ncbi:TetR/AcrR family transcriptional regulator [Tunturiibacter gelidoferens]|uniref:TetR/AcrR family transcriptional regulator n=1 Tax=Tunturiibacter gelidiferens TaxID=3069689 RepID=A0AAU7YV94_9BACT
MLHELLDEKNIHVCFYHNHGSKELSRNQLKLFMPRTPTEKAQAKKEPQARRIATNTRILDAALAVFTELGFEHSQLEQVAARAGCSRGAIYAQYASKEEVFLALMKQHVQRRFEAMYLGVKAEPEMGKRLGIMRQWFIDQVVDPSLGALTLEFKLYAVRRPESKERLLKLHDELFGDFAKDLPSLLFGNRSSRRARETLDRRLAALGGALSGMRLESDFRPSLLPAKHLQTLVGELFDTLVRR